MKKLIIFLFLFQFTVALQGQSAFHLIGTSTEKISFELINNLIVVPVEVNGAKLSFILDSGAHNVIIFNWIEMESVQLKNTESIFVKGLGVGGKVRALRSKRNILKVGSSININQKVYVIFDEDINLSNKFGKHIHGILGMDFFRNLVVEINYKNKYLRLTNPHYFKAKKRKRWQKSKIEVLRNKMYLNISATDYAVTQNLKLLIDTGSSDALWLFEDKKTGLIPEENRKFRDYLGAGLSGSIYGNRSKLQNVQIEQFLLPESNVAFPDSIAMGQVFNHKERNGSLGGEILKRFRVIFDYKNRVVYLRKNTNFKKPFLYNNAGIVVEQEGERLVMDKTPSTINNSNSIIKEIDEAVVISFVNNLKLKLKPIYKIVDIRSGSNAEKAGLLLGDIITRINGNDTTHMNLQDLNNYFYAKEGTSLRIKVERFGRILRYKFTTDNVFNNPSTMSPENENPISLVDSRKPNQTP